MSVAELLTRARQACLKHWDVIFPTDLKKILRNVDPHSSESGRFFFEPSEIPLIVQLLRGLPAQHAALIKEQADQICQHRFKLLGYENLDYGSEIDWHLDVVNGKRAPRKVWFKVPYLSFSEVGDHKVVWELNRHQHLVTLAKAYCLTGEPRYIRELCAQWYHWNKENPYPIGINWSSSLEVSFRTLSWLWVRQLLEDSPLLPTNFRSDLLIALAQNARHISRNLSTYFSPNTHLIGEAVALFFVGILCPQIRWASEWKEIGWDILIAGANRQVLPDGVYFEQSIYYHVYALDLFLHARILAARNGRQIPRSFDRKIEQMAEVLSVLAQNGVPPRIGDDDGGRLFDPRRNDPAHMSDPLSTAAVVFERPDFKAVSAGIREETLWLLGAEGAAKFASLPVLKPQIASRAFQAGGLYIMTSPAAGAQLVARAGQMGALQGGHSHSDLLSLNLSINGEECLSDPGTFRYICDTGERDQFRGTAAHNTVRVAGVDQAQLGSPFSWAFRPAVRVQHWIQGHSFDLLTADHNGYQRLGSPATHCRWIVFVKPRFWFVRDIIEGQGHHLLEMYWHLAPAFVWKERSRTTFLAAKSGDSVCALSLISGNQDCYRNIHAGPHSRAYGTKAEGSVLEFRNETQLPHEFATVLFPGAVGSASLAPLPFLDKKNHSSNVTGYEFGESGGNHFFFFARAKDTWAWQGWASDAAFFYCRVNTKGELVHFFLCNGSFAEINGRRIFENPSSVSWYEWVGPPDSPQEWRSDQVGAPKNAIHVASEMAGERDLRMGKG